RFSRDWSSDVCSSDLATVHGLEPVAHVRQRPLHDHAHRVVQEGIPDFILDESRQDFLFSLIGRGHRVCSWFGGISRKFPQSGETTIIPPTPGGVPRKSPPGGRKLCSA